MRAWTLWLSGAVLLASAPAAAGSWAVTLPWHVKVRPGAALDGSSAAALSAARGECEGFQVLVRPSATEVDVQPLALKGPGPKLSVRLYREAFIEVRTPSNSQGATGLWPDPLIPVEDPHHGEGRRALPASSLPDRPLVLYAEACVPAEQSPGTYRGKLTLRAKGLPRLELPVQLQVQPFTLPATSSLPNSFGVSLYSLSRGHHLNPESGEARRLLRDYGAALLMHRLSPHGMSMRPPTVRAGKGELSVDFAEYDEEMAPFLDGKALPSGARFSTAEVREPPRSLGERERVAYYRHVREHFAERGWKAQLFYYAKDEPKPDDVPLVLAQSSRVRSAGSIPVLITAPLDSALGAAADILCPTLNCFFPRPGPQTCRNVQPLAALREQLGPRKKVWWYQSCNAHGCTGGPAADPKIEQVYSGWASYMLDHPATLNRAMGPLAFLAGIDGELYFDTVYAYNTKKDPWSDVFEFGGNGDGTLFYPGTPDRIGGKAHIPVESLRLKHIRDGLEDFEYLTLLAHLDPAAARKSVEKLVRSGYEVTRDPGIWDAVRVAMTTALAVPVKPGR